MPRWVLTCPDCGKEFTHNEIREGLSWWDEKPEMAADGESIECPNCKKTATYYRYQLIYRKDQARGAGA
jgi:DNA-directed RNA polymerase subunit RPC12/RpoP